MIDFSKIDEYRENNRIEAKKALGGLPESIWETYSAFANTLGGIILRGVEELPDKSFRPVDLPNPERMIEKLFCKLNDKKNVSANILTREDVTVEEINGNSIIAVHVPRAKEEDLPIYINNDPYSGTFLRCGEGDRKAKDLSTLREDGKRPLGPKAVSHRMNVVLYLTKHLTATKAELCAILNLSPSYTGKILKAMADDGLITVQSTDKTRRYELRK